MVTDLWEDMSTLNSLYEELCWDPDEELEFKPDFANDCIVIRRKEKRIILCWHIPMALLVTVTICLASFVGAAMLTQSGDETLGDN